MHAAGSRSVASARSEASVERRRWPPIPVRTLLGMMMAVGLLGGALTAHGQAVREASIGLLTERLLSPPHIEALRRGLTEAGWPGDGRSFRIEERSVPGNLQ